MKLYIDTEFDGYRGRLISMAIVDEDGRNEFYDVLASGVHGSHDPWVAEHVLPVLYLGERDPVGLNAFQNRLAEFLSRFGHIELIADYPSDIQHFCWALETGPGERIPTPTMVISIRPELNTNASLTPHNALADARALRDMELAS